jgi:hypothetical protein
VQTRYLRFKGMLCKIENYLCDINCVQMWKALIWFRCGNTQLEREGHGKACRTLRAFVEVVIWGR